MRQNIKQITFKQGMAKVFMLNVVKKTQGNDKIFHNFTTKMRKVSCKFFYLLCIVPYLFIVSAQ